jgi:malonyl-CoA O-methyltransferase
MFDTNLTPVAERFSQSAHLYEDEAVIQREAAARFEAWLARFGDVPPKHVVEIGCGTGFLTQRLRARYPGCFITATDLAPSMVERCREAMQDHPGNQFVVCDGRQAVFDPVPDWIVSTMCFQWFDPLKEVLEHHLAQCDVLAFSIMLDGSFSAWRRAHEALNLVPGLHSCPNYDALLQTCLQLGASEVKSDRIWLQQHHPDGRSFARSLRAIGADEPRSGHVPVNLKPVLRLLEDGCDADYEIGFFRIKK